MPKFERHVFICINEREAGHPRGSCAARGSKELLAYCKERLKGMHLGHKIRVNGSMCLDHCEKGPVAVIYPEASWYHLNNIDDAETMMEEHVLHGRVQEDMSLFPINQKQEKDFSN